MNCSCILCKVFDSDVSLGHVKGIKGNSYIRANTLCDYQLLPDLCYRGQQELAQGFNFGTAPGTSQDCRGHFSCKSPGRVGPCLITPGTFGQTPSIFPAPECWDLKKNRYVFPEILAAAFNTSQILQVQLKNKTHANINLTMKNPQPVAYCTCYVKWDHCSQDERNW